MRFSFLLVGVAVFATLSCTVMNSGTLKKELATEYLELADAYAEVKRYDKAADFYERAARHENYYNVTRYKLARVYALAGKWQETIAVLEPLFAQEPDNLLISNAYAFALLSAGENEKALPIYERNYLENTQDPVQARNYAEMLFLAERYEDARGIIAKMREEYGDAEYLTDLDDLDKRISKAEEKAEAGDNKDAADSADAPDNTDTNE